MDVTSLSDEELSSMLSERGFTPGPIVDSTRRVYQKKLARILDTNVHAEGSYSAQAFEQEEYSEADDDEEDDAQLADTQPIGEVMEQYEAMRASPARSQRQETYSYRHETAGDTSHLTRRALHQTNVSDYVTQATPPPEQKKGGLSICAQLVIFLVVALLIFLVIQNMEPAAKDPLAGIGAD